MAAASLARARALACQLSADWLSERVGAPVDLVLADDLSDPALALARGSLRGEAIAVGLLFLAPPTGADPWHATKADLEERLAEHVPAGSVIWAPQGAELPAREPHRSAFILAASATLGRCVPGGHGEIRLPVTLTLRKSDADGTYVTARGGLAPSWARFTNRVFGHFQLDSTELSRLPAGEAHLDALIDEIVTVANRLNVGDRVEVATEDAWVAQRLRAGVGVALLGEPPAAEQASGAALRRGLRRTLPLLRAALVAAPAAARLVFAVGPYTAIEQQPVSAALLGFDPAVTRDIDLIALAAEGQTRVLLDLTRRPFLATHAG